MVIEVAHRLRFALTEGGFELLSGEVKAGETYIGGKEVDANFARATFQSRRS